MQRGFVGRGMLNFLLAATAGMFMPRRWDFRDLSKTEKPKVVFKAPFAKTSGRQRSSQKADRERLILDRSSSVRKAQRWLNSGSIEFPEVPNATARNRHKVRRVEAQRAANLAKLAAGE